MNLVLDIGNSFAKLVLYSGEDVVFTNSVPHATMAQELKELYLKFPRIGHAILCAVGPVAPEIVTFLTKESVLIEVNSDLKLPYTNRYETPETLGADRIALVATAAFKFPNKNCLVIDAGSCVTYDFISAEGVYRGGAISPGLQMRFKAMHEHTEKLPLVAPIDAVVNIGTNTQKSLLAGAVNGLVFEIEGWSASLGREYEDLTVILTGGDAQFLSKRLKNTIFANPNFLAEGLRQLLDYNKV